MKCSQCGCKDLIKVDFPQKVELIKTNVGINCYSHSYDINNKVDCDSYICVNCGHYEFFDLKLAEKIKTDRKRKEEI